MIIQNSYNIMLYTDSIIEQTISKYVTADCKNCLCLWKNA